MFFKNKALIITSILICVVVLGLVLDVYRISRAREEIKRAAHEVTESIADENVLPYYPFRVKPLAAEAARKYRAILKDDSIVMDTGYQTLEFKLWKKVPMTVARLIGKQSAEVVGQSAMIVRIQNAGVLNSIEQDQVFGGVDVDLSFPFQERILFGFTPFDSEDELRIDQIRFLRFDRESNAVMRLGDRIRIRPKVDAERLKEDVNRLLAQDAKSTIERYSEGSPRIVVLAMLTKPEEVSDPLERVVLGFGAFFLEKFEDHKVQGYFITHYMEGNVDSEAKEPQIDYLLWRKGVLTPTIVQ